MNEATAKGNKSAHATAPRPIVDDSLWPLVPSPQDAMVLAILYQLEESEWWPIERLFERQTIQLGQLVSHAVRTVPLYRDRLGAVADAITPEAWRNLPVLTRADIQNNFDDLQSGDLPPNHGTIHQISTSGSTGAPVSVRSTTAKNLVEEAINLRRLLWHRRDFAAKAAVIASLAPDQALPPHGRKARSWAPVYPTGPLAVLNMRSTVDEQIAWLQREKPAYLMTYPNLLRGLVERCEETATGLDGLLSVGTRGEPVPDELRADCRRVLGAGIVDGYSAEEVGLVAVQCPEHEHYHVQAESTCLEVVDADGRPCAPGETGRVLITPLHNFAMPLIRYEIGDLAEVGEPCSCGRGLPVLRRILGRYRNLLIFPNGNRMRLNFRGGMFDNPAIRQIQVVQTSREHLKVRFAVKRRLSAEEETGIRRAFHEFLEHPFEISFEYVDEIERQPSGKFEDFRSEIA